MKCKLYSQAFTLIELLVVVVVLGIVSQMFLLSYQSMVSQSLQSIPVLQATERAASRMSFLLSKKKQYGISFVDPCYQSSMSSVCEHSTAVITNVSDDVRYIIVTGIADDERTKIVLTHSVMSSS